MECVAVTHSIRRWTARLCHADIGRWTESNMSAIVSLRHKLERCDMSDSDSQALQPLPHIEPFEFHGDALIAVIVDGREVVLPIRSVCGVQGLDTQSQS